jgi:TRAP-type C4-dicarboxylate transport system permease large subunit
MKRKILIGVVVVIGIAAAFFMIPLTTGALIVAWIYLAWMVWKKKTNIFYDQMEPKSAERRLKWLKASLLVAAIFLIGGIVGAVVNQVLYATEVEDAVTFFFAFVGVCVFILATSSSLVIFLKGRRRTTKEDAEISTT